MCVLGRGGGVDIDMKVSISLYFACDYCDEMACTVADHGVVMSMEIFVCGAGGGGGGEGS